MKEAYKKYKNFFVFHFKGTKYLVFVLAFVFCTTIAFASPPGSPFSPGETLDPSCAPTDTNCTVSAPVYTNDSLTNGALLYANSSAWSLLSAGTNGQVLTLSGGLPTWSNPAGISADSLDFVDLADNLSLDASTDIALDNAEVFSITNTGTGNSFVVNDSASDTSPFVIDASGNVGIGTSAPDGNLEVKANSTPTVQISNNNNAANLTNGSVVGNLSFAGYFNGASNDIARIRAIYTGDGTTRKGDITFETHNSGYNERMRITSSGNVGIGTSSPDSLLHAEVSDTVTNAVTYAQRLSHITSGTATTSFGTGIEYELENGSGTNIVAGAEEFIWYDATNGTEDTGYRLKLMNSGTLSTAITIENPNAGVNFHGYNTKAQRYGFWNGTSGNYGYIRSSSDGIFSLTNAAESDFNRLQFGGTTSSFPSIKRNGSAINFRLADDSADASITAGSSSFSGNVGIGTASPSNLLNIYSTSDSSVFRINTNSTTTGGFYVDGTVAETNLAANAEKVANTWYSRTSQGSGSATASILSLTTSGFQFFANTGLTNGNTFTRTEVMRVGNNGNVGIGTTSPSYVLDVKGTSAGAALANFQTSSGNTILQIYNANTEATPIPRLLAGTTYMNLYNGVTVRYTGAGGSTVENFRVNDSNNNGLFIVQNGGGVLIGPTTQDSTLNPKLYITKSDGDVSYTTGIESTLEVTGNSSEAYGLSMYAYSKPATGKTVAAMAGGFYQVSHATVGSTTDLMGINIRSTVSNGTVTRLKGINIESPTLSSGTLTNAYGLYINNITAATNNYSIYTGTAQSYFGGNVGIGTTGPDRKLDILDATNPQLRLTYTDGSVYTDFQTTSTAGLTITPSANSTDSFKFTNSSGTQLFTIDSTNNKIKLGTQNTFIGSSGDGSTFASGGRGFLLSTGIGTATNTPLFNITGSTNPASGTSWGVGVVNSFIPTSGTAVYSGLYMGDTINQTGGANGITRGLYINPTLTAAADFRAIEMSNNIGYGVYQSGASATNYFAGNVGIGTASPSTLLHLSTTSTTPFRISNGANNWFTLTGGSSSALRLARYNNDGHYVEIQGGTSGAIYNINSATTAEHIFQINGVEKLRINSSGNLGIGTASPVSKLHVSASPGASANYGTLSLGGGAFDGTTSGFFVGSASGTSLAVNEVSGYAGNLMDLQVAGSSKFKVTSGGVLTVADTISATATGFRSASGSVGAPGYSFNSDATMGMWRSSSDLAFSTGGTERLRIKNSTGAIGIGTSSPSAAIEVASTSVGGAEAWLTYYDSSSWLQNYPNFAGRMARGSAASPTAVQQYDRLVALSGGGYYGSGWSGPGSDIAISVEATQTYTSTNQGTRMVFYTRANNSTTAIGWMYLNQDGTLDVSSLVSCLGVMTNANGKMSCTSDATLKDIQGDFTAGLDAIRKINPQTFSWKSDSAMYDGGVLYHGFIAQNVRDALPEAVNYSKNGKLQISELTITAAAINAIKELDVKLSDIETIKPETLFRQNMSSWLADIENGLDEIVAKVFKAKKVETEELCVGSVCVTEAEFLEMVKSQHSSAAGSSASGPAASNETINNSQPEDINNTEQTMGETATETSTTQSEVVPSTPENVPEVSAEISSVASE